MIALLGTLCCECGTICMLCDDLLFRYTRRLAHIAKGLHSIGVHSLSQ
jgi:hypothetical protein